MFRFSIRDLLWLTLVVAVALAWLVRELEHRAEAGRVQAQADQAHTETGKWRGGARALAHVLQQEGRHVRWNFESSSVSVFSQLRTPFVESLFTQEYPLGDFDKDE